MAVTGGKPKPEDQRAGHKVPVHDWTEVLRVPFDGSRPDMPADLPSETQRWWGVVSTMPHCVLWDDGDWQFALDTAQLHARFIKGVATAATELRVRESRMGTTMDARRDLRIRYVEEETASERVAEAPNADVMDFQEERRRRLTDAG